jgi:predicted outer membrane repeat protein
MRGRAVRGGAGGGFAAVAAVLAAGLLLAWTGPAAAAGVFYAAVRARGAADCSSRADACTLSAALARVAAGGVVELVTAGSAARYTGNWAVATAGTSAGQPVTIRAVPGLSSAPVLDGNGGKRAGCSTASCAGPVLTVPAGTHVRLTGITITGGDDTAGAGGGLDSAGAVTITGCRFTGNSAKAGGAIASGDDGARGSLRVFNSTFTGNSAQAGGAIASGDDGQGSLTVGGSAFTGNAVSTSNGATAMGGAIASGDSGGRGSLRVTGSTFTGNTTSTSDGSEAGGAIASGENGGMASATVSASVFTSNKVSAGIGGAIASDGSLTVIGSTFTGDGAYGDGGAVASGYGGRASLTVSGSIFTRDGSEAGGAIASLGAVAVTASTFYANSALEGGAIYAGGAGPASVGASTFTGNDAGYVGGAILSDGPGPLTVTASTFSGNGAGQQGGAIASDGPLAVTASTFSGNGADQGGGAIFGGPLTVTASTLTGNTSPHGATIEGAQGLAVWVAADVFSGGCDHAGATWNDAGYNAASSASCFGKAPPRTDVDAGSAAALKLGRLDGNGGPTQTILPRSGSPVIGIIPDPATVTIDGNHLALCPATDQRGYASAPGPCDAGSVQTTGIAPGHTTFVGIPVTAPGIGLAGDTG